MQVVSSLETGGAEKAAVALAMLLKEELGLEPVFATLLDRPKTLDTGEIDILQSPGISGRVFSPFRLREAILSTKPDLLIGHMPEPCLTMRGLFRSAKTPRIEVLHSTKEAPGARGKAMRMTRRYAGFQVAVSEDVRTANARRGLCRPDTLVVPNAFERPPPISRNAQPSATKFCCVANFNVNKDHRTLIYAMKSLLGSLGPDGRPVELHLVGDGPLLPEVKELTQSLGLDASVTFHGSLRHPWQCAEDLDFALLITHGEGRPTVQREAASLGLPLIATRVDGVDPELTFNASSLHRHGDAVDLANKMKELMLSTPMELELDRSVRESLLREELQSTRILWKETVAGVLERCE